MKDYHEDWDSIYNSGFRSGTFRERIRILEIIQECAREAGERSLRLQNDLHIFIDDESSNTQKALAGIAGYEQQNYVNLMEKINLGVEDG